MAYRRRWGAGGVWGFEVDIVNRSGGRRGDSRIGGFVMIFKVVHGRFRSVYRLENEMQRFHQPRAE